MATFFLAHFFKYHGMPTSIIGDQIPRPISQYDPQTGGQSQLIFSRKHT